MKNRIGRYAADGNAETRPDVDLAGQPVVAGATTVHIGGGYFVVQPSFGAWVGVINELKQRYGGTPDVAAADRDNTEPNVAVEFNDPPPPNATTPAGGLFSGEPADSGRLDAAPLPAQTWETADDVLEAGLTLDTKRRRRE